MSTLTIVDVGHGNSAVLVDSNGIVVFDAGPGSTLLTYLTEEGIKEVDEVLLSHADKDHIEGLVALLASGTVRIRAVRFNTDSLKTSALWNDLVYEMWQAGLKGNLEAEPSLTTNLSGKLDKGKVRIEVVAPSVYLAGKGPGSVDMKGRVISSNAISAVFRLVYDGIGRVLLAGDIDDVGLDNIEKAHLSLKAGVLVFPHHGGLAGNCVPATFAKRMCELVSPEMVVFSIGRGEYGTPQPAVVAAVRDAMPSVRIACTQLSERCAAKLPEKDPLHLLDLHARGREGGRCCAGTMRLEFGGQCNLLPSSDGHAAFVRVMAPTALCRKKADGGA